MKFHETLKDFVEGEGWSPTRFATEMEFVQHPISESTARNWISGKTEPMGASVHAITRLLEKYNYWIPEGDTGDV